MKINPKVIEKTKSAKKDFSSKDELSKNEDTARTNTTETVTPVSSTRKLDSSSCYENIEYEFGKSREEETEDKNKGDKATNKPMCKEATNEQPSGKDVASKEIIKKNHA